MQKTQFKRATLSAILDALALLAFLVMTAGYIGIEVIKVTGVPETLTKIWSKLDQGLQTALSGKTLGFIQRFDSRPGVAMAVVCGALSLLFLIMLIQTSAQSLSILKKNSCLAAGFVSFLLLAAVALLFAEHYITGIGSPKWYLLAPAGFFLLQSLLKFSAYKAAY